MPNTYITKVVTDSSPDFGDNPQTITESGQPSTVTIENLVPGTSFWTRAELYENGVLADTSEVESFTTLPAGQLSLSYYDTTRSGYIYDYVFTYSSTYAPSFCTCTCNGSTFNGFFDYNQHSLNFNISGLSPNTTYPTVVTLVDLYGESVSVNHSITTTYVNSINIVDYDAEESFVDVGLQYVVDGGFLSGWVDVWYDYQDPSTDMSLQHYSFSEGDTVIHCYGLADNTGYLFRASIMLDDRTTVINSNVVDVDTLEATYLSITDISGVVNTLKLTKTNADGNAPTVALEYSTDKVTWTTWEENNNERSIAIPANGTVYFRGNNANGFGYDNNNKHVFSSTGNVEANGDLMRIINKDRGGSTAIPDNGFRNLFNGMSTLKKAPAISATTYGNYCCTTMYQGCGLTDLSNFKISNPTFPSGSGRQFFGMFLGCRSLTSANVENIFNKETLVSASNAYNQMFAYCSGLTATPEFTITSTLDGEFTGMFQNCSALYDLSKIRFNATAINAGTFMNMFQNCTSLKEGLDIRSTTSIGTNAITNMYSGCTSLNVAYAPTVTWNTAKSNNWLNNVAATGTLYADESIINSIPTSNASGCPTGWNMYENEYIDKFFTITNESDYTNTISIKASTTPSSAFVYSVSTNNGSTWTDKTINSTTAVTLGTLSKGRSMLVKSTQSYLINVSISATYEYSVSGNIRSLRNGDNFLTNAAPCYTSSGTYKELFKNSTQLISAENLVLYTIATYNITDYGNGLTIDSGAYYSLFEGCTNLTKSPKSLPAEAVRGSAYNSMFKNCRKLMTVPKMKAILLQQYACESMFERCELITSTPEIKATQLEEYACRGMFRYCSSLTTASDLPSTYVPTHAYDAMFFYCSSLTKAPTTIGSSSYYIQSYGCSDMFAYCTSLETAPELPSRLGRIEGVYNQMFNGCTKLNKITVGATYWENNAAFDWVNGVSATGTFTKPSGTSIPTGTNGIPSGWTVVNV